MILSKTCLCSLIFYISVVSTHVLKLEECQYHANFSRKLSDMALNQVPLKTISNVNKTSCSLYCTVHRDCYYFNLQRNTGTCELLEFITDPSLLETKTGWDFIHTNLYAKAVGPRCNSRNPCLETQVCYDTCGGQVCKNPVLLQPDRASMGETKPSSKNSFAASNAIDGDLNTYTAAEFNKLHKNHFYLWIHFGKTYLFVYMRCKLLNYQGFHLRIGVDEKLSGSKWLGYMGSNYCNYNARSFKTTYKMVKGRYARLSHPGNGASGEFRLAEIEFYGF